MKKVIILFSLVIFVIIGWKNEVTPMDQRREKTLSTKKNNGEDSPNPMSIKSSLKFTWWKCTDSIEPESSSSIPQAEKGRQIHIPVEIKAHYHDFLISLMSGFVTTEVDFASNKNKSLDTPLDIKLNLAYEYLDHLPLDFLFGVDLNLPIANTCFTEEDFYLFGNPELFPISKFGEGFNINPTINAAKGGNNWIAGIGLGYAWRGTYDFCSKLKDYDPGEIINFTTNFEYDFLENWKGIFHSNYAHFYKDKVAGQDYFQEGNFTLLGLGISYYRKNWHSSLMLQNIFRDKVKSKSDDDSSLLITEEEKRYGDEQIIDLSIEYLLDDQMTFNSLLEYRHIEENGYPSFNNYYFGGKDKLSLKMGIDTSHKSNLTSQLYLTVFQLQEEKNWFHPDAERNYGGFTLGGTISRRF